MFIYTIFVLRDHPKYSNIEKEIIGNALYLIKGESIISKLNIASQDLSKYQLDFKYLDNISLIFPVKPDKDISYNSTHTDYLWAAFFATGDKNYLKKILRFLSKEELLIRTLAFEMLNRDVLSGMHYRPSERRARPNYDDLERADPDGKKRYIKRLKSYYVILWSMDTNRCHYADIHKKSG